jgi:hypothetical protein
MADLIEQRDAMPSAETSGTTVRSGRESSSATTPVNIPVASSTGNGHHRQLEHHQQRRELDSRNADNHRSARRDSHRCSRAVKCAQRCQWAPVVQASEKGLLIGEWFEYTPTSGTEIAVATPSGIEVPVTSRLSPRVPTWAVSVRRPIPRPATFDGRRPKTFTKPVAARSITQSRKRTFLNTCLAYEDLLRGGDRYTTLLKFAPE